LVQMKLNDGGFLSIRSGTEMVFDRFVYDEKNAENSNFLVSLVRGGFRSITGLIGRTNPNAYQIRTTTATVGIRGTDHEPMVIPEGNFAMSNLGPPGFYDKVNEGETFIRNAQGELALKRGQIGFTPANAEKPPLILLKIPDFYRMDVKTDARDTKDGADNKREGLLRPSAAARSATLKSVAPTTTVVSPVLATAVTPVLAPTTTLIAPTTLLIAPTTTVIAPVTTVIAPTTTLIAPTTTIIAPKIAPVINSTLILK
jgi:hypothetical protein